MNSLDVADPKGIYERVEEFILKKRLLITEK
jgi:hypothetical protein